MPVTKITNEMFSNFKSVVGFEGPYRNQYLKGIALGPGVKKFENLEEAIEAAEKNPRCGGITVSRQGYYTLRRKSNLYDSDINNKFKSIEITYVKIEDHDRFAKPSDKVVTIANKYEIVEVAKYKKNIDPGTTLEIINVKGNNYYYNILTRKLFDLKGFYKGKLEKGKLVLI